MLIKNIFNKVLKYAVLAFSVFILFSVVSCSNLDSKNNGDDNSSHGIPLSAPNDFVITGKDNELIVQFTRVSPIGAGKNEVHPSYKIAVGKTNNFNEATQLQDIPGGDVSTNLVKFSIVKAANQTTDSKFKFEYNKLTNGEKHYIFVRSVFEGFGQSANVVKEGTPVPAASAITGFKVKSGDRRIVVSWDKKAFEEYYAQQDCPKTYEHLNMKKGDKPFWDAQNLVEGNHYIISMDDNSKSLEKLCVISYNANGFNTWYVDSVDGEQSGKGTIKYNTSRKGIAATEAPKAFDIVKNRDDLNERAEIKFQPVLIGNDSVSEYKFFYKEANQDKYTDGGVAEIKSIDKDGFSVVTLSGLENGKSYDIKLKATNTKNNTTGVESNHVTVNVKYSKPNFNNLDEPIGVAKTAFIFAEDVPHSDFARIEPNSDNTAAKVGRPNTDRLTRAKETAIGSLFSEAAYEYVIKNNKKADFAFLIGGMINNGLTHGQLITPRVVKGLFDTDFIDDELVVYTLSGNEIINANDSKYNLDSPETYPTKVDDFKSLLGQTGFAHRKAHYGGGHKNFSGKHWGMPSSNLKYTIQYKEYLYSKPKGSQDTRIYFKDKFKANCSTVNFVTGIDSETQKPYDGIKDEKKCYLINPYSKANPVNGKEGDEIVTYKRGIVKSETVFVKDLATGNFELIDPNKKYRVVTTKSIADLYPVFLPNNPENTNLKLLDAINAYIYNKKDLYAKDFLTGKVKIIGGVPGNTDNDYKEPKPKK